MRLEKLHLVNFKNYADAEVNLTGSIHCFLGKNGSGKTNLLEAIHYLCFTKGSLYANDIASVRHGQSQFVVNGLFDKNGKQMEICCSFSPDQKKSVTENSKTYSRFSEHIGKYPLVLVAPNDIELIWNGGEVRRKFLDTLLAQVDKEYLENLITYQAHLRQRNGSLKMMAEQGSGDPDLLELYNEKMAVAGMVLHLKRAAFIKEYLPLVSGRYDFLASGQSEEVGITYHSDLEGLDFKKELNANMHRDIAAGRTTLGVHRDDYLFTLKGHALKRFGSQGQQKSFLIALKLAEFDYLAAKNGTRPLILLDDIFDKLDDERILRLLELVTNETFGQVFITDARPGRSLEVLSHAGVIAQSFIVEEGNVTPSQPWQLN